MDARLVAWARAVKVRRRRAGLPVLWLFTDAQRMGDPVAAVRRLPRGLCGVVFRHDGVPGRAVLAASVAAACRARGVVLVVAGDWRLAGAVRAGWHMRGGRRPGPVRRPRLCTASAHGMVELVRARRAGAGLVFLSPVFATASHPGGGALGSVRWAGLAGRAGVAVAALGGIGGGGVRRLGRLAAGVGAIGALL